MTKEKKEVVQKRGSIRCVMLVDDNDMDNEYHRIVIEGTGLVERITVAHNGKRALEMLEASAGSEDEPELIFLDLNMPVMDGFEFLAAFRTLRKRIPLHSVVIVMLTTSIMKEDRERAQKIPELKGFFYKPLTAEGFREIVEKYRA